jgi:hypothetical protein
LRRQDALYHTKCISSYAHQNCLRRRDAQKVFSQTAVWRKPGSNPVAFLVMGLK